MRAAHTLRSSPFKMLKVPSENHTMDKKGSQHQVLHQLSIIIRVRPALFLALSPIAFVRSIGSTTMFEFSILRARRISSSTAGAIGPPDDDDDDDEDVFVVATLPRNR
jgi:hypothetical protein